MNLLHPNKITSIVKHAVDTHSPLSLTRLGDGEYTIIQFPKRVTHKLCLMRINRWFDVKGIGDIQINNIRRGILEAYCNSDIIGIPSNQEQRRFPKWKNFHRICRGYGIFNKGQKTFYFYDIKSLSYKNILENVDMLYCITCRHIDNKLEEAFHLKKAETFYLPPEKYAYRGCLKSAYNKYKGHPHFPDLYNEIIRWLNSFDVKGKVFFIGAGGLAKIYCNIVKQKGGIAIDIGALFDAWAGVLSRPYLRGVKKL